MKAQKPENHPSIDTSRCTGCGRCVAACYEHLLTLEVSGYRKHAQFVGAKHCTSCRKCRAACPVSAISFQPLA